MAMIPWKRCLLVTILVTAAACGGPEPHVERYLREHRADIAARDGHAQRGSLWGYHWRRIVNGVPPCPPGGYHFPQARPDASALRANRDRPTLTWIGHSTFLVQIGGTNILTDPHFTERASSLSFALYKRHMLPALEMRELPPIDVIVISHNHADHLDLRTARHLAGLNRPEAERPQFLVPLGLKKWFADEGIHKVKEFKWWEQIAVKDLNFHFTPVKHWSGRGFFDRGESLWGSWVIEHPRLRVYFGGDFGYSNDFADVRNRLGSFDLALLPIGGYGPRDYMQSVHIDPSEAVQVMLDLGARQAIASHWGTFKLSDEPFDEPPQALRAAVAQRGIGDGAFVAMHHGETRSLDHLLRGGLP